jgi:hypothetical protein
MFMNEKPRFYRRYVDDVIAIVEKGKAEETLKLLNSMHENIEFTVERGGGKNSVLGHSNYQKWRTTGIRDL